MAVGLEVGGALGIRSGTRCLLCLYYGAIGGRYASWVWIEGGGENNELVDTL